MIERFFLDRVNMYRTGIAIHQRVEPSILVDVRSTPAPRIGLQDALIRAGQTLDIPAQIHCIVDFFRPFPELLRGIVLSDLFFILSGEREPPCEGIRRRGGNRAGNARFNQLSSRQIHYLFFHLRIAKYILIAACSAKSAIRIYISRLCI